MFRCEWSDTISLRELINGVSDLVDTASFYVDEKKFRMETADPSVICKIEVDAGKEIFSSYKVDSKEEFYLDMNLMKKIGRRLRANDKISVNLEKEYLEFTIHNFIDRYFRIPLLEFIEPMPQIKIDPDVFLRIRSDVFRSLIEDIAVIGGSLIIQARPDEIIFFSEEDGVKTSITISETNSAIDKFSAKTECISKFNLSYIQSFLKTTKLVEYINISFGKKDTPLKLEYLYKNSSLRFYLAPMEI
ncbi:MAG: hypothetical protein U9N35_03145 [Euryarchaeota archaeon]|nr:hypothetical protein [Euryarchaeota archaeon]